MNIEKGKKGFQSIDTSLRFWNKVEKSSGCWLWNGARIGNYGYGGFWFRGRTRPAHIYSYEKYNGPILKGLEVMHTCDTPLCVRPSHLMLGTHAENMKDAAVKERLPKGEASPKAKWNEVAVLCIRWLHEKQGVGSRRISRAYGLSRSGVQQILQRKIWGHI